MNEIEVIDSEFDCSKIEERMQSYIDSGILSCCSTLLMKGSEVVDYRTFGYMDSEDKLLFERMLYIECIPVQK